MGGVLITGASGFVGGHLVRTLARGGLQVIAIGGETDIPAEVVSCAVETGRADLTDRADVGELLRRFRPDVLIHSAAMAQGAACEREPERAHAVNVTATEHLLSAAATQTPPPLVIYISTDLVFDGNPAQMAPFAESDTPIPRSVYAETKRMAELRCVAAPIPCLVVRVSLVYGERLGTRAGALDWMIGAIRRGEPVTLFSDEFRTPIHASDIGRSLANAIRHFQTGGALPRILHIPGPERCSRYAFGEALADALGERSPRLEPKLRAEIDSIPPRPEDSSLRSEYPELLALPFYDCRTGLAHTLRP